MINNRLNTYASGVFEGRVTHPPVLNQWSDVTSLCEADSEILNWVNTISPGPGVSLHSKCIQNQVCCLPVNGVLS